LAILARPHALQQLFYYTKSFPCVQPFQSAHKSILTLFEGAKLGHHCSLSPDNSFINIHGTLFTASLDNFYDAVEQLLAVLDKHIGRITAHSYKLS